MRTKNSWGSVIYDKTRNAYRARYQNPHKPGSVVQRVFSDKLTAQGWLATEKQLVEADKAGLGTWTHPSEREAQQKAKNERNNTVFKDYAVEYVANWRRKDGQPFAEATKRKHREYLDHLMTASFINKTLASVTEADIYKWLDTPMNATPRLRAYQLLKDIMKKAERTGLIERSPVIMKAPKLPKSKQAQIPVATREELETIYASMPEYCRIAVYLGACFDLRINEVCALQIKDFDLRHKVLHVRHSIGKGEGDRGYRRLKATKTTSSMADLSIPDALISMLMEQIDKRDDDRMLIESPKTGGILSDVALRRLFNLAAAKANRSDMHFHTLRATAIDTAIHQGATLRETMALGRHDDEKTSVERYQRASPERLRELSNTVATSLLPLHRTREDVESEVAETRERLARLESELAALNERDGQEILHR
ncbi:tyrosine-type recombinase/integrase [Bifidobacterium tibiigranuli]|jgi:integrase|uniref:tyrosine-type recombinase/integrase n=1 Tax=Bifidobacterium tibiigranuli TaxID=2172043 RepID=UPI00235550A5|nr:tyrosine-type recombinase/integrase [Bifidobacterium tibiigranuli]MCI1212214.1 tyrosine-type recombinase/integrase [Bifidobacterium tibiigranuli]MCI1222105.1 tyrosine-type recombinase/integrase [Bifidobacterium tibiigranuli]